MRVHIYIIFTIIFKLFYIRFSPSPKNIVNYFII